MTYIQINKNSVPVWIPFDLNIKSEDILDKLTIVIPNHVIIAEKILENLPNHIDICTDKCKEWWHGYDFFAYYDKTYNYEID